MGVNKPWTHVKDVWANAVVTTPIVTPKLSDKTSKIMRRVVCLKVGGSSWTSEIGEACMNWNLWLLSRPTRVRRLILLVGRHGPNPKRVTFTRTAIADQEKNGRVQII